jgi:hypothetical protein
VSVPRAVLVEDDLVDAAVDVGDVSMRVPRYYGGHALLAMLLLGGGAAAAWSSGWRPPQQWQRSEVWQALHLPVAAAPRPAPAAPAPVPVLAPDTEQPDTDLEPLLADEPPVAAPVVEQKRESAPPVRHGRRPPRPRDMVWSEQQQRLVPAESSHEPR